MSSPDGRVWVTYNGEIYNFPELRTELERAGHRFKSDTDTEILVHAYQRWGDDMIERLRGMFAFGLWDAHRRRLLLARDRVGQKPLFWTKAAGRLLFASELAALVGDAGVTSEPDLAAIDEYLTWGYIPAPRTGYVGIEKVPPGHVITVQLGDAEPRIDVRRYWNLDYQPKSDLAFDHACIRLRELMTEAVRLRLMSDVPLGAFLSGGIDSSIVVGLMSEVSSRVKTFSIGFEEAEFNELPHARRVAERWGTEHTEFVVKPDALEILPELVRHYGEPYADSSAIPTYYLSQLTRTHVTVALNGDGGDESFGGYERYWGNVMAERLRRVPGWPMLPRLGRMLPQSFPPQSLPGRTRRFLLAAAEPMPTRYARWSSYFDASARARIMSPDAVRSSHRQSEAWMAGMFDDIGDLGPLDAAMAVDVRSYLPFDLLVKVDIASMMHSLEARSPFLDHHVMEFAARLPESFKLRGRKGKFILREAFTDLLPRENVRRPKMGFGVPVGQWLRGPMRELVHDTVLSPQALTNDYLQPDAVRDLVRAHMDGRADHTPRLWALLILELWHRDMRDRSRPA